MTDAHSHAIPGVVDVVAGNGGLTKLLVTTPHATAEVYVHGAHVTAYQPTGQAPVLFLSKASRFEAGKAIRGGVPICFPWFGNLDGRKDAPAHGFARTRPWDVASVDRHDDGRVTVRLALAGDDKADPYWPHAFRVGYAVTVGPELVLELTIHHAGGEPFLCEAALHSYFAVGDVRQAAVRGLENTPYLDKTNHGQETPGLDDPVRFAGETDRVYLDTTAACCTDDPVMGRTIHVRKAGSASTVVWNPWVAKAAAMADFGDDEWPGMVCVETAAVGRSAVRIEPGASHTMTARIGVGPFEGVTQARPGT